MKPFAIIIGVLALTFGYLLPLSAVASDAVNVIHPVFPFLDAEGKKVIESDLPMSLDTTCGNCHDTAFIGSHSRHNEKKAGATCVQCHFDKGQFGATETILDEQGLIRREFITIHKPTAENCSICHGFIQSKRAPLLLPEDFGRLPGDKDKSNYYDLTKFTGEILSGQKVMDSYLNVANKGHMINSWDIHAARMVDCTACHYSPNNPQKLELKDAKLPFLINDPRRLTVSQYLHHPDHQLAEASCTRCHDPLATHEDLPNPQRHFDRLDCRSCHVQKLMGPAWQSIDATVRTSDHQPRVSYRGIADDDPAYFSTTYMTGYQPYLLWEKGDHDDEKLAPYNIVTRFEWIAGTTGKVVPEKTVEAVYFQGDAYASEILAALDENKNNTLELNELRLDTEAKVEVVRKSLERTGVSEPEVKAQLIPYKIHHGVQDAKIITATCANCHSSQSRLNEDIVLANYSIAGVSKKQDDATSPLLSGRISKDENGRLKFKRASADKAYLLGHDRAPWSDSLGFLIFLMTAIGIGIHGGLRIRNRSKIASHDIEMKTTYMYSLYERIWHWLMAASILLLVLTGVEIHWVSEDAIFGFSNAVWLHNMLAVVMIVNAFLSLFYHLASSDIKQFIPPKATFFEEIVAQTKYYLNGIFVGAPHPVAKSPERKLNPLQQVTYMMLLNVLIPFQVISGVLIWGVSRWPGLSEAIGGLTIATPLHNFGAWLLVTFVLAHVYLTTTGHTLFSNIRAMATGYEKIEAEHAAK